MPCILIVDDEALNIKILVEILRADYKTIVAKSAAQALQRLDGPLKPDLILSDIMMPDMDGYALCAEIKTRPGLADIPVIFISANTQSEGEARGFEVGGVDYVFKPVSADILKARVANHLELCQSRKTLAEQNRILQHMVSEKERELSHVKTAIIQAISAFVEEKVVGSSLHVIRSQKYVQILAESLRKFHGYDAVLTDSYIRFLYETIPLHDVGLVAVPDNIILKTEPLAASEFEMIKTHTDMGLQAIANAAKFNTIPDTTYLDIARDIIGSHHENWDGSGYPQGLKETEIPLAARMTALVDVYDALVSPRIYKDDVHSHAEAVDIIVNLAGRKFDPDVVRAFQDVADVFAEILQKYVEI
jgi:putative two-component system response regulator